MHFLWDIFFSSLGTGFGRGPRHVWPPEGEFGSATKVAWAAAGVGVVEALALVALLVKVSASLLHILRDPMMLFFGLILIPILAFVVWVGIWLVVVATTASAGILWGDRKAWARAAVCAAISLLLGATFMKATWTGMALLVISAAELLLLALSRLRHVASIGSE
jgi:hypothetical protein